MQKKNTNFAGNNGVYLKMKELLCVIILVGLSVVLLSVKIILKKNGRMSSMHIGDSRAMRKKGIHCVISQDREMRTQANKRLDVNNL